MSITQLLSQRLKLYRDLRGYTQDELAKRAKLSSQTIKGIESEKIWVSPKSVAAIAQALKINETDLFCSDEANSLELVHVKYELFSIIDKLEMGTLRALFGVIKNLASSKGGTGPGLKLGHDGD